MAISPPANIQSITSGFSAIHSQISYKWEIVVNTRIAKGRNVLSFPREYSRNCLRNSETMIYLIDVATGGVLKSPIFTSSKNKEDKFVYAAWKILVKQKRLKFRDRIILNARGGNNIIEVEVVRRRRSH
ncbi:hypothetical protein P8452_18272 [Trifolium repens]|nr:hypothetical protein QL285_058807 [Trifolium repens]WJX29656.1 hypothetical protein P8452_18272 [Trifolium repens]